MHKKLRIVLRACSYIRQTGKVIKNIVLRLETVSSFRWSKGAQQKDKELLKSQWQLSPQDMDWYKMKSEKLIIEGKEPKWCWIYPNVGLHEELLDGFSSSQNEMCMFGNSSIIESEIRINSG